MRRAGRDIDPIAVMRAANPVQAAELGRSLGRDERGRAMRRAIAVGHHPAQPIPPGDRVAGELAEAGHRPRARAGRPRRRLALGLGAGLAIAAIAVAIVLLSGGSVGRGRPAFAAAAIEVARANPRLLVTAPGWSIVRADEFEADEGEVTFGDGAHELDVHWYPARMYGSYLRDRASVSPQRRSRLLGRLATTVHYGGAEYATMLAPQGAVFLEIRGRLADHAEYEAVLRSLRPASVEAWLAAMPPSVVRPEDRGAAVERMLRGVPLPPGFDPSTVARAGAVLDRYQLGAKVTGAVACGWVERWLAAHRAGDEETEREAVTAMASSSRWPILRKMAHEGGWPANIRLFADEIAAGRLNQSAAGTVVQPDGTAYALGPAYSMSLGCKPRWRHRVDAGAEASG